MPDTYERIENKCQQLTMKIVSLCWILNVTKNTQLNSVASKELQFVITQEFNKLKKNDDS